MSLIRSGRDRATPVAVVHWATTDRQQVVRTTLAGLAAVDLPAPSVIVVGPVAGLDPGLGAGPSTGRRRVTAKPLAGRSVVVTRTPGPGLGAGRPATRAGRRGRRAARHRRRGAGRRGPGPGRGGRPPGVGGVRLGGAHLVQRRGPTASGPAGRPAGAPDGPLGGGGAGTARALRGGRAAGRPGARSARWPRPWPRRSRRARTSRGRPGPDRHPATRAVPPGRDGAGGPGRRASGQGLAGGRGGGLPDGGRGPLARGGRAAGRADVVAFTSSSTVRRALDLLGTGGRARRWS